MRKRGALLMLSNSDTQDEFFEQLYSGFQIHKVKARRNINSDGASRGPVGELVITSY